MSTPVDALPEDRRSEEAGERLAHVPERDVGREGREEPVDGAPPAEQHDSAIANARTAQKRSSFEAEILHAVSLARLARRTWRGAVLGLSSTPCPCGSEWPPIRDGWSAAEPVLVPALVARCRVPRCAAVHVVLLGRATARARGSSPGSVAARVDRVCRTRRRSGCSTTPAAAVPGLVAVRARRRAPSELLARAGAVRHLAGVTRVPSTVGSVAANAQPAPRTTARIPIVTRLIHGPSEDTAESPYCLTSCESRGRFMPRSVAARVMFPLRLGERASDAVALDLALHVGRARRAP